MNTSCGFDEVIVAACGGRAPLGVFAIFLRPKPAARRIVLGALALEQGTLKVMELQRGTVGRARVQNDGQDAALLLSGDRLTRGGQDRVVVTSALVLSGCSADLDVNCVEKARWNPEPSQAFGAGDTVCSADLRSVLATMRDEDHHSRQRTVWHRVDETIVDLKVDAPTSSLSSVYSSKASDVRETLRGVEFPRQANGIAVAIGDRIRSVDLFGSEELCHSAWRRIVLGCSVDVLRSEKTECTVTKDDVASLLNRTRSSKWQPSRSDESRSSFDGYHASSLFMDDSLAYSSVVAG